MATTETTLVGQWRDLQDRYLRTAAAIERELNAQHKIGLSEFEVLDLIAEIDDPEEPCRMKDLGSISPMTQSALSRIVDRLEKAGLVARSSCQDDRRALKVAITDAGRGLHAEAARTHRRLLKESFGEV
jgi:DNA-binding MarR family transcriptional regulator